MKKFKKPTMWLGTKVHKRKFFKPKKNGIMDFVVIYYRFVSFSLFFNFFLSFFSYSFLFYCFLFSHVPSTAKLFLRLDFLLILTHFPLQESWMFTKGSWNLIFWAFNNFLQRLRMKSCRLATLNALNSMLWI